MQGTYIKEGREIDYTASADIDAGDVVVQGQLVGIAKANISNGATGALSVAGIFDVVQAAESIPAGAAVYWDANGNPVGGVALSGAATATASGNTFMGFAQALTADTDSTVRVALRSAEIAAASVATATSITGTSATLPIAGLAAAQGGAVSVTGGASSTAANAGGAATVVGGAAGAEGVGGAVGLTGGAGGSTSGNGGAVSATGGAATTNGAGGAVSLVGGAGKLANAGGAIAVTGGVGGATGAGGAIAITGGAGGSTSGTGGAVTIAAGAGSAGNANGGALSILAGNAHGSGTDGVLSIGTSNTSAINVGAAGILTAFAGPVQHRATAAVTATVGGGTDGLIPAGTQLAIVTSDTATKQISLPAASVGDEIEIYVTGKACELISAVTAHTVNGVQVGATNQLALVQDSLYRCKYVATNKWIVTGTSKLGEIENALTPDAR